MSFGGPTSQSLQRALIAQDLTDHYQLQPGTQAYERRLAFRVQEDYAVTFDRIDRHNNRGIYSEFDQATGERNPLYRSTRSSS